MYACIWYRGLFYGIKRITAARLIVRINITGNITVTRLCGGIDFAFVFRKLINFFFSLALATRKVHRTITTGRLRD